MIENKISIFNKYAKNLLPTDKKINIELSEQIQIPLLIDTLCRQRKHHLLLIKSSANKFNEAIIETLAQQLSLDIVPKILQEAQCIYFDVTAFLLNNEAIDDIENDFRILLNDIQANNKRIIFVINQLEPLLNTDLTTSLATLGKCLKSILHNEQWRLIVLTHSTIYQQACAQYHYLKELFTAVKLNEPTETECIAILKSYRSELESFHHVAISEDAIPSALSLANTYLAGAVSSLDKALELLDSAAARTNALPQHDLTGQKSIVTSLHLAQVVSGWTQIPLANLQNNKFQMHKLVDSLQRQVFGQETAIQAVAAILQNACIKLQKKSGPLCSFLLAGPLNTGKTSMAYALAEHLFGRQDALLRVNANPSIVNIDDLTVTTGSRDEQSLHLLQAVQQIPYAILLFDPIEQFSPQIKSAIQQILMQGYALDRQENKYHFQHAIIMLTTSIGADKIVNMVQAAPDKHKQMDLMQLVLNEHVHDTTNHAIQHINLQEVYDLLLPELIAYFSMEFLQQVNIVPFLPLDYTAMEKIIRAKLKSLTKRLDLNFGIELSYASEVIKFLAHEAFWQRGQVKSLDKLLEQQLYACVAHEILTHIEDKHKPKRLLLQLNDNGQLLRCEVISASETSLYNL